MSLGDMELYANTLRSIPKNNTVNLRLVGHRAPTDPNRSRSTSPRSTHTVDQFLDPDPTHAGPRRRRDRRQGQEAQGPAFNQATVKVEVRNGNGKLGAAADTEAQLIKQRLEGRVRARRRREAHVLRLRHLLRRGDGLEGRRDGAEVDRPAERHAAARPGEIAALNAATTKPDDPTSQVQADVVLVVGSTFDTLRRRRRRAAAAGREGPLSSDRSRDAVSWKKAQRALHHALMMPTRLPNDAVTADPQFKSYNPFRVYKLRGRNALHVTYYQSHNPAQTTFGVQVLDWDKPPILQAPNQTRTLNGITYSLYFNGAKLHRVAWRWNGRTYWLSNSIVDGLSNSTMWAIATGFRRVP